MIPEAAARAIQLCTIENTVAVERRGRVAQAHSSVTADRRRLSIRGGCDGAGAALGFPEMLEVKWGEISLAGTSRTRTLGFGSKL